MSKKIIIQDLVSETGEIGKVTVIGDDTPAPTPTGTISITENGTYDVAEFAEAEVEVEEPQGLVDLAVNYINSNYTLSAIVENNEVKNFTDSHGSLAVWIPLRKPFVLNNGDIITLVLANVNNGEYYWDVHLIRSCCVASELPIIPLIVNQRIVNGRTVINYSSSTIPVFGIKVTCRHACSGCNLKISLAVNGETLF
jgi:hypothetical protein